MQVLVSCRIIGAGVVVAVIVTRRWRLRLALSLLAMVVTVGVVIVPIHGSSSPICVLAPTLIAILSQLPVLAIAFQPQPDPNLQPRHHIVVSS